VERHECEQVGLDYFDTAAVRIVSEVTVDATAAEVFACLEDADAWPKWAPAITHVEWTSPRPFGLGTTRTVSMVGGMVGEEAFIAWEPDRRMAFYFTHANMPAAAFAEDYTLTDMGRGRVRVRWVMAMTPMGASKRTMPLVTPILAAACRWMLRRFAREVRARAKR
jgi:uncharacterized protein YndB with AHSA1/START domain